MKKIMFSILSLGALTPAVAATPIDGLYGSAFGGYTYVERNVENWTNGLLRDTTAYNNGYNLGLRFGYQSQPLRYELEYTYLNVNLKHFDINGVRQVLNNNGETAANMFMANIYYDFPDMVPCVSPFLGFGIGYAHLEARLNSDGPLPVGATTFKASDNVFAYQGTAGMTYNFSENWGLNLAYRYVATNKPNNLGKVFQAHIANAGVVYRFDEALYK